ncbi:unnamed protein product, partial [Brachionus calyciflorus]
DMRKKYILESWFNNNLSNPYPPLGTKIEFSEECNLTLKQIESWFASKRSQLKRKYEVKKLNEFSSEKKNILRDFFLNIDQKPNKIQIKELAEQLATSEKKISKWFIDQRFNQKKKNN